MLWLPAPPDNANAREHWAVANRRKRGYWRELEQRAAIRHGIPAAPARPLARATIAVDWHYPTRRHHLDPDNAVRRLKPVTDWLVAQGYLAGDTAAHLTWLPLMTHVGASTPPLCTVQLTLTPAP